MSNFILKVRFIAKQSVFTTFGGHFGPSAPCDVTKGVEMLKNRPHHWIHHPKINPNAKFQLISTIYFEIIDICNIWEIIWSQKSPVTPQIGQNYENLVVLTILTNPSSKNQSEYQISAYKHDLLHNYRYLLILGVFLVPGTHVTSRKGSEYSKMNPTIGFPTQKLAKMNTISFFIPYLEK